ncbi:hypothetical protein AB0E69_30230 [Kribbella sp. NPDC026611]|uniref:hypothetical protein n=1 Tax=Kribbella sp. NPDC026611 TaxID=3154911 RepID=UPI0033F3E6AC
MADANLHALVRAVSRLVAEDTKGWSSATADEIARRLTLSDQRRLRPLADNLDVPARLAPGPGEVDRRPEIRGALTELVAHCAAVLEPDVEPAATEHVFGRNRLGMAMSRAYAAFATPRLVAQLGRDWKQDDLGLFPQPVLEGDAASARALAIAIIARKSGSEQAVLTELVAAGRGAVAPAAAEMLLQFRPEYEALPAATRGAVQRLISDQLEAVFEGTERHRLEPGRDPIEVLQDRQAAVGVGSAAITAASIGATAEIAELFDKGGWPEPVRRPGSMHELYERIRGAVGELTGVPESRWNGRVEFPPRSDDAAIQVTEEQQHALEKLVAGRPLDAEEATLARAGIQSAAASLTGLAVPAEYGRTDEAEARTLAPKFLAVERAVGTAFAEDHFGEIVDRTLPPALAYQVRRAPHEPDRRFAPAARAFASVVDAATDRQRGETLREMAGQGRTRMAMVAAEALVAGSAVLNVEGPFAKQMIAGEIDRGFEALPVDDPHREGLRIGKVAERAPKTYAANPGFARSAVEEEERRQAKNAQVDGRFAPGSDPASTDPSGVTRSGRSPSGTRPGPGAQAAPRERESD